MTVPPAPSLEIDADRVAARLGMDVAGFRQGMERGQIRVLCERGTGADAGTWRATFYAGDRRARFLLEAGGAVHDVD